MNRTEQVVAPPAPSAGGGAGGLTSREAAARLRRDGPNVLLAARTVPAWRRFAAQLLHFFAQEYRAERAAAHLRDLLPRRALVVRPDDPR